ncbi:hypothetical protein [Roseibacillus ishigakijimensis]|uniref:Uncharacterized protein n=1 Tax=Roseibacillus ishigakijimensis TaxID=454146 RepID=A0A934RLQ8_9BACT|nr:hypothetical protein [Roseibacillus ishigakijimensis]MBK1833095.1 hypothetical protein [Roseibacillus ishigakijimensis]
MKIIRPLLAIIALSTTFLRADHHGSTSKAEHLLQAADHLEKAGAKEHADSIRAHVKGLQEPAAPTPKDKEKTKQDQAATKAAGAACCPPQSRAAALRAGAKKEAAKCECGQEECEKCAKGKSCDCDKADCKKCAPEDAKKDGKESCQSCQKGCQDCDAVLEKLSEIEETLDAILNQMKKQRSRVYRVPSARE